MRYKTIILLYNIIRDSGGCVISLSLEVVFQSWESISPTDSSLLVYATDLTAIHYSIRPSPSTPVPTHPSPPG